MPRRTGAFLKEFVVLFGFLNGVWIAVGVNPGQEFLSILRGIVESLAGGNGVVDFLFTAIPLLLLVAALIAIWRRGGWLGFAAVALGFLSGLNVVAAPRFAFVALLVALGIGWVATR